MAKIYDFKTKHILANLPYELTSNFPIGNLRLVDMTIKEFERCTDCLILGLDTRLAADCAKCPLCGAERTVA